jgi:TolB-like protein
VTAESHSISRDDLRPTASLCSIAILPFANLTTDKENEYFSDGLAEEIINALSMVPGLRVVARTSSFAFRGLDQDVRRVGSCSVCEPSWRAVFGEKETAFVTAQLIDTTDGYQLWSNRYDGEMNDIFDLQDELAQGIVSNLKPNLQFPSKRQMRTVNVHAYHEYLKGTYLLSKQTPESMERACHHLNHAIALDPTFAAAYVGLGDFFYYMASHGLRPIREFMPLSKSAASAALQLDGELPEAQVVRGIAALTWDYDWNCAEQHFKLALDNERTTPSLRARAVFHGLVAFGRTEEAIIEIERAIDTDPLSSVARSILAYAFYAGGRHEQAIGEANRALEMEERHWPAYYTLALIYLENGLISDAMQVLHKGISIAPFNTWMSSLLAACWSVLGNRNRVDALMEDVAARGNGAALGYALYHAQLTP